MSHPVPALLDGWESSGREPGGAVTALRCGEVPVDRDVSWTLGFQVDDHDLGMGGAGGCSAWWSFTGEYAAAYVTRGLGDHDRGDEIWRVLA